MKALKIIGIIAATMATLIAGCACIIRRGFRAKEYAKIPFPIN